MDIAVTTSHVQFLLLNILKSSLFKVHLQMIFFLYLFARNMLFLLYVIASELAYN